MNQNILDEITNQDYASITKKIEDFIQTLISKNNANGLILGFSGGIDSAVIGYLCARQSKEKTHALIMPDTDITPKTETEDALKMVHELGIDYKLIDIKPIVYEYSKYLEPNEWAIGNLRARVRTNILYYYANSSNYLVVGSSDKSEYLIGYFTKFGDGASDMVPIISLYKTQVRKIARFLGVPENVVSKKSSPHLWKEHFAEKEIGVEYDEIEEAGLFKGLKKGIFIISNPYFRFNPIYHQGVIKMNFLKFVRQAYLSVKAVRLKVLGNK